MKNAEELYTVKPTFEVKVTGEDIDDIMVGALEGGITYWCRKAEVVGDYLGEYASDQISRGGELILFDSDGEWKHTLNKEKFLKGLRMYFENKGPYEIRDGNGGIDCCLVDAVVADMIIQYAIFDDVIYG